MPAVGAPSEVSDSLGAPARLTHLSALDGLRGVAVAAVVIYHLSPDTLSGGFLGVDVFFVLSGFLITSLLLTEIGSRSGVSLRNFYLRRFRRLAPAMVLVLATLAGYSAFLADPVELSRLRSHGLASLLWVANWQFIFDDTSYTEALTGASPLRHMWSLAIEEQFYILFPLLLVGLVLLTRGRAVGLRPALIATAAVGAVASAVWMAVVYDPAEGIERAYFGTDTHAHGLLTGVVLGAILVGRPPTGGRAARWLAIAAVPAAVVVVGSFVIASESADWLYRGGFAAVGIAVAVLIAAVNSAGWLSSALSWRPLVGLGVISYGVYLWHWPVIVLVTEQRTGVSGLTLMALQLVITMACALASYFLLERPVRAGALGRRLGRVALLSAPFGILAVGAVLLLGTGGPQMTTPTAQAPPVTEPEAIEDRADRDVDDTYAGAFRAEPPESPHLPVSLLVLGDSVAHTLMGGEMGGDLEFEPWEPQQSPFDEGRIDAWSVAKPVCSFLEGRLLRPGQPVGDGVDLSAACGDWRADLSDAAHARSADYVLIALANDSRDRIVDGQVAEVGTERWAGLLGDFLDEVRSTAGEVDAEVVLLGLPPRTGRFADPGEPGWRERAMANAMDDYADDHPEVISMDLGDVVCPGGDCDNPVEGFEAQWRFDGMHYNAEGARWFAEWLTNQLLGP